MSAAVRTHLSQALSTVRNARRNTLTTPESTTDGSASGRRAVRYVWSPNDGPLDGASFAEKRPKAASCARSTRVGHMERLSRAKLKMIKALPMREFEQFLMTYGQECFRQGVEEGQKCFDDPDLYQFVDADLAKEVIGEEKYNELTKGE